jgi:hypothetical protein
MTLSTNLAEPLRWGRANGWRPLYPGTRRNGLHTWVDAEKRLKVSLDICGEVQVYQRVPVGWVRVLGARVGCWQAVLDALMVHGILPHRFSTAYLRGVEYGSGLDMTRERLRAIVADARARVAAMSPERRAELERGFEEARRHAEDIVAGRRDPLVG